LHEISHFSKPAVPGGNDTQHKIETMLNLGANSLWGVLVLIGDIWAIINILKSAAANEKKLLWIVVVVLLPVLGLVLWYFLGPRSGGA
jgi:hypothetical protein